MKKKACRGKDLVIFTILCRWEIMHFALIVLRRCSYTLIFSYYLLNYFLPILMHAFCFLGLLGFCSLIQSKFQPLFCLISILRSGHCLECNENKPYLLYSCFRVTWFLLLSKTSGLSLVFRRNYESICLDSSRCQCVHVTILN